MLLALDLPNVRFADSAGLEDFGLSDLGETHLVPANMTPNLAESYPPAIAHESNHTVPSML